MRILNAILITLTIILFVDLIGFNAWIFSGQTPDGNFYIGTITVHILRFMVR